jgi:hypothetical protein
VTLTRTVQPEILDSLPADDPAGVRSRRDLRLINALLGNQRWLRRKARSAAVVEIGAGDGSLARKHVGDTIALDLAPRPEGLPERIDWRQGDLFETLPGVQAETLVACLILHHFDSEELARLGERIRGGSIRRVLAAEPYRSRLTLAEAYTLFPLINRVTRHDMMVSIRAGFRRGELAPALGLDPDRWLVVESVNPLGALRFEASRR